MKQLSILIALILMISADVQAKKYKVFYLADNRIWMVYELYNLT
jgi:hypothetical protein